MLHCLIFRTYAWGCDFRATYTRSWEDIKRSEFITRMRKIHVSIVTGPHLKYGSFANWPNSLVQMQNIISVPFFKKSDVSISISVSGNTQLSEFLIKPTIRTMKPLYWQYCASGEFNTGHPVFSKYFSRDTEA